MMKKSNIYTRTGDNGTTALASGQRVPKTHPRLEAYGTLDELNSHLGLLATGLSCEADAECLLSVQNTLFVLGAYLATECTPDAPRTTPVLDEAEVDALEQAIDEADSLLPPWRGFILPGGTPSAAQCHVCRTVCRRAERRVLALSDTDEVDAQVLRYLNRLSDYLFVLARKINFLAKKDEILWQKSCRCKK